MGRPSIALAQAFQFDLKLGQREVIGEWVPEDEPGISDIATKGKKWLRGILWSEIDAKMILRRIIHARGGPKEIEIDLRRAHMISEELAQLGERPVRGPAIICEKSGYPWTAYEFRRWWRQVANAAGVPKTVFNMDSREGRTGANAAALDDYNSADGRLGSDERTRRLIQKVKDTLPKSLTDQVREDVVQEMLLAIHSGEIIEADICRKLCRRYVAEQNNRYDNRYNTLSLDQPAPGKDDGELGDLISSEHSVWSEVP
jgi:hypothetical protein